MKTAHRYLRFQVFSVGCIRWLHWRQGHTHTHSYLLLDWQLEALSWCCTSRSPHTPLRFPSCFFTFPSVSACVWPTGGKWVTPLLSLDTIALDTKWWEREQEGAHSAFSWIWVAGAGALVALKWMLPLMVKSIRDGDSVARLQTVTIADYNSTTPLPQHTPLLLQPPHPPPPQHCLFRWSVGTSEGFRGVGLEGEGGL